MRPGVSAPGSEASPSDLLQHVKLEFLVGHELLQAAVLGLELAQAPRLIERELPVRLAPAVVGLLEMPRVFSTTATLLPLAIRRSASCSLRTICSGVWGRPFKSHLTYPFGTVATLMALPSSPNETAPGESSRPSSLED